MARRLAAFGMGIVSLALVACSPEAPKGHPRIFDAAPWTGDEMLTYDLMNRDEVDGQCTLETDVESAPGQTTLKHLCSDATGEFRDDRIAIVDSATLAPISAERIIKNSKTTTVSATYKGATAALRTETDGEVTEGTRELPPATDDVPEPTWYDDESLFWLIRGVPLRSGFEQTYTNLNAANGRVFDVKVIVKDVEKVSVPAGQFDAWLIRIQTDSIVQEFWVEEAAPNRVIKARIERINYVLTGSR